MRVPGLLMTKCKSDRGAFLQCSAPGPIVSRPTLLREKSEFLKRGLKVNKKALIQGLKVKL